jgi:hypothetical protein
MDVGDPARCRLGDLDGAGLRGASGARHRQCVGRGWLGVPTRVELFRSLPAVLRGDAAAGLDGLNGSLSSPSAVWIWVVVTEVILLAVAVFVLKLVVDRWGPGRLRGMASRGEAERLLGVTRLRKVRTVVRPDLYRKNRGGRADDVQAG